MPEDAPQAAPKAPSEESLVLEPEEVTSLTQIVEAVQESPPRSDPIILEWYLPPSKAHPKGRLQRLTIETKFPDDAWLFGIRYQTELKQKIRETKTDEKGKIIPAHPLADVEALAREVVVKPTWLHNESALQKFKDTIPSPVFRDLRARLMLAAGLNGDFFDVYQQLTVPQSLLLSAFDLQKGSASTPPPSTGTPPGNSSPGSTTTGPDAPKPAESGSPTTSGS